MTHMRVLIATATLGALATLTVAVGAQVKAPDKAEVALRAAMEKENVAGDLKAAIDEYRTIATTYAKSNRAVGAKALLRLGGCYEKLGQAEARKTYQELLSEYADQTEVAAQARTRLAALTTAAAETAQKPTFRKIRIPTKLPMRASGMLSPSGQTLAFISEGAVWIIPIHGKSDANIAGAPVRLTEPMRAWDVSNVSIAWSSDGKWIGFRTGNPSNGRNPIEGHYIVPAEGGKPERLSITWKDWFYDVYTLRHALSADAETLYFADGSTLEDLRIYSMPAQGGERLPLTEPAAREPALSPDGSRIAYVKMQKRPESIYLDTRQVWVKPLRGGDAVLICEVPSPAWLRSPVWSPDGTMVAFLSDPPVGSGPQQIWVVPVSADGRPAAAPSKFDLPGQTNNVLAGWTRDNRIGILIPSPRLDALYTVPAEGGKATQLTTGYTAMPRWTPGGTRIYFDGAHGGDRANLEYVPSDGGKVTRIPVTPGDIQPAFPSQLSISPDGKTLCFVGFYRSGQNLGNYLFTVPVEGGTASRVAIELATDNDTVFSAPEWSPDGTQIAFIVSEKTEPGSQTFNICVVPRGGGKPRQVSTDADRVERSNLAWSPDGEVIAFFGQDSTLRLIPAAGGSSRILVPSQSGPWAGIDWSPDGKRIAYTIAAGLQVVSRDGAEPVTIATGLDARHLNLDWSPDGMRIAFTAASGGEPELWLIGDFLHLVKKGR